MFSFMTGMFGSMANRRTARPSKSGRKRRGFEQLETRQMMSAVPAFSSLPSADVTVYLDFDGHFESQWGNLYDPEEGPVFANVTTPVFSRDADPNYYNATELQMIEQIWRCVAEDYAPFNINVTTVEPAEFGLGTGLRVAIGGSYLDWYGENHTGVGIPGSYRIAEDPNTVYVFSDNFDNGDQYARQVADIASHEAGHAFGLGHQEWKDANGVKIGDYNPGDAEQAPLMGDSRYSQRSLWWTSTFGVAGEQNDIKKLVNGYNEITIRADDHGDTFGSATPLNLASGPVSGVITLSQSMILNNETVEADVDAFVITLPENGFMRHWQANVGVDAYSANFDAKLEIYRVQGKSTILVGVSDPDQSLGAGLTFEGAGQYLIKVKSHGGFGDIGQYKLDVFQTTDTLPSPELLNLPPLIDIVCDPLQPVENPGLIVSPDVNLLFVTKISTAERIITSNVTQLGVKSRVASVSRTPQTADNLALDLAFADLGGGKKWGM